MVKDKPTRCEDKNCRKKLVLTDLICKCEKFHCMRHRLPETHSCSHDFKNDEKNKKKTIELLECKPSKILKI